jgi:hypothetical protein
MGFAARSVRGPTLIARQEYFEEAEAGASLIAVLAPEPRLVTEAQQILASDGARHMRFYDSKCITDLT